MTMYTIRPCTNQPIQLFPQQLMKEHMTLLIMERQLKYMVPPCTNQPTHLQLMTMYYPQQQPTHLQLRHNGFLQHNHNGLVTLGPTPSPTTLVQELGMSTMITHTIATRWGCHLTLEASVPRPTVYPAAACSGIPTFHQVPSRTCAAFFSF
jgi:hypothetical protein